MKAQYMKIKQNNEADFQKWSLKFEASIREANLEE